MVKHWRLIAHAIQITIVALYLVTHFYGAQLPYFSFLQVQIKAGLQSLFILTTIFLPRSVRWVIILSFAAVFYLKNENLLFNLLFLAILTPRIEINKLFLIFKRILPKILKTSTTILLLFLLAVVITWAYFPMSKSYFEGDEWVFFRMFTPLLESKIWWLEGFITTFDTSNKVLLHKTPFANMAYIFEFKLFGLEFIWYFLTSLFFHLIVCWIIFKFFLKFTGRKLESFLISLLFATLPTHSQAVTWIMAALHTQFAVGFGFLSMLYTVKNIEVKDFKTAGIAALSLLLALWSKETAIIFIPLILFLYWQYNQLQFFKNKRALFFYIVVFIFIITQLYSRQTNTVNKNNSLPWSYRLVEKIESYKPATLTFAAGTYLLKLPAQTILPAENIISIGKWLTDKQFPYFNQEKSVNGTNYTAFIYSPMPELISYVLSISILIFLLSLFPKSNKKLFSFAIFYYILSIIPLIANILQFPWLSQAAFVDSRHLYHISPAIILVFVYALKEWLYRLPTTEKNKKIIFLSLMGILTITSILAIHRSIQTQQDAANFEERKRIVTTLQMEIPNPPPDLVLYTKSNSSYYGFATMLLPFQTAFSHMLPVLFSKAYLENGNAYPNEFYTDQYLKEFSNGLATEGYHSKNGYGLGYYLNEIPLIKLYERSNKSLETLYAFEYDGESKSFKNMTLVTREKIAELLNKRTMFKTWKRYGSKVEGFSFQVDPHWKVAIDNKQHQYTVYDEKENGILAITSIDNSDKKDFATYVLDEYAKIYPNDEREFTLEYLEQDLDYPHSSYLHPGKNDEFYILSGNNKMFYKVTVFNHDLARLILRTFEFNDMVDEDIGW